VSQEDARGNLFATTVFRYVELLYKFFI